MTSPEDYTSRRFAEVIVDFMDSLHIAQAVLLATDIALLPSLLVGLDHPRRVSKLAVMDGIPFPRPSTAPGTQKFCQEGLDPWQSHAFLSYFQNFRMGQEYFEPHAHELQTPVLVVWGKYDRFISSKLGFEIAEKLPNAKLKVIDKSGHYVHMDTPQKLVQVVTRFLGEEA